MWTFLPYEIVSFTSLSCFRESARLAIRSLNGALSVTCAGCKRWPFSPSIRGIINFFCLFVSFCIEDLHPCISVTCYYFGQCQASSPGEAHCACQTDCPTFEDHVCGSNGKTYQNHCFYKLDVCQTRTNITVLHTGACYGEYSQIFFSLFFATTKRKLQNRLQLDSKLTSAMISKTDQ